MFAKPYKLKSTNSLKNSEKKHLAQRILDEFQNATEEKVKELVPVKSSTSCLKLILHSGEIVAVYAVDNLPMIIETEIGLVPTVCALWKVPDLVPSITIHSPVLGKILGGAPLYLPGVVVPPQGVGFPTFPRGAVISAHTADNAAAGLVGRAALTSGDMLLRNAGVCMETVHVFGDLLCKEPKFSKVERPRFSAVSYAAADSPEQLANSISEISLQPQPPKPVKEEWPSLGRAPVQRAPVLICPAPVCSAADSTLQVVPEVPPVVNAPKVIPDGEDQTADVFNDSVNSDTMEADEGGAPPDMDGLLRWCLLCWLRIQGKSLELPLKTNLLYRNHLFPLCPPGRTLDVKKSTYKKMGKFLEAMQREGVVEVKEIDKGVDAVVAVNLTHPAVRAVRVTDELRDRAAGAGHAHANAATNEDEQSEQFVAPTVRDMLCVTAAVIDLFPVKKGTALTSSEVRNVLTHYVKQRSLTSQQQKGHVLLDQLLAKVTGRQEQECMKWDELTSSVCGRMTAATELRWPDGDVKLLKTRLEPITMQVATRSGNKKVTLVSNLEAYGFRLAALSVVCQRAAGASCGVTRAPGARCDQLMLQGDQTHFVAKLLIEKYGLPKKFLEGADKALNKKK